MKCYCTKRKNSFLQGDVSKDIFLLHMHVRLNGYFCFLWEKRYKHVFASYECAFALHAFVFACFCVFYMHFILFLLSNEFFCCWQNCKFYNELYIINSLTNNLFRAWWLHYDLSLMDAGIVFHFWLSLLLLFSIFILWNWISSVNSLVLCMQAAADKAAECQLLLEAGIDPSVKADVKRLDSSCLLSSVLSSFFGLLNHIIIITVFSSGTAIGQSG